MSERDESCTSLPLGGTVQSEARRRTDSALLELSLQVAQVVARLHASGRIHRALHEIAVEQRPAAQLAPPLDARRFGGPFNSIDFCPPELQVAEVISLPADIGQAVRALQEHHLVMRPERIDLYQFGAFLCRAASGHSVSSYLKSPKVKASIHPNLQAIIDAALGYDPATQLESMDELVESLQTYRKRAEDVDGLPFRRLDHYEIVGRIGRGGMGDVYKGYERALDRVVAIKVLPSEFARHPEFVDRFRAEATAIASLTHPNIVPVYFIGEDQGHHFFAMQYIHGESVAELLQRRGRLDVDEALAIIEQVLAGLQAAHDQGIIHRDIKPGNVLIDHDSRRAFVADFGLVKSLSGAPSRTATGMVLGTVDYVSPEQGRGNPVDARSDLYSVGVFAYQLLSGELPFQADSPTAMVFQHVYEQPTPLRQRVSQLPRGVEAVIGKLMAKAPADRYQSAAALMDVRALPAGDEPEWVSGPSARSPVAEAGSEAIEPTAISQLPGDDVLTPEEFATRRTAWWVRARHRLFGRLQAISPELAERLQNTQQLFAGAVAEYQRRHDRLNALLVEAEDAITQLRRRRAESAAASDAGQDCHADIAALDVLLTNQEDETEDLRLEVARVRAKLGQLRSQRDLLDARLKAARTRPANHGAARAWYRVKATLAVVCVLLFACGIAALIIRAGPLATTGDPLPSNSTSSANVDARLAGIKGYLQSIVLDAPVSCLVFDASLSASTTTQLTVGLDQGTVMIVGFDTKGSRRQVWTCRQADQASILSLAYSPNGELATGNANGIIRIWDAANRASDRSELPYRTLTGHAGAVGFLRFSDDGSQLLSASADGTARLWNVLAERELDSLEVSEGYKVASHIDDAGTMLLAPRLTGGDCVVSPAPNRLAIVGFNGEQLRKLDMAVGQDTWEPLFYNSRGRHGQMLLWQQDNPMGMRKLGEEIWSAGLSADGNVALTSMTDGSLVLWDLNSGGESTRIMDAAGEHRLPRFGRIALSRDGQFAATVDTNTVHLWKLSLPPPASLLRTFHLRSELYTVALSPDGSLAAAGTPDGVKYWRLDGAADSKFYESADARYFQQEDLRLGRRVSALVFTHTGDEIIYATGQARSNNNVLGMLPADKYGRRGAATSLGVRQFQGHTEQITSAVVIDYGQQLLSGSRDRTLRLWSLETGLEQRQLSLGVPINDLAVSPDQSRLLVATDDGSVRVLETKAWSEIARLEGHSDLVLDVGWSPEGSRFISASADRTIRVWDAMTLQSVTTLQGHSDRVNSAVALSWGRFVLSGSDDRTIRYWDADTGQQLARIRAHEAAVTGVDVDKLGSRAVSSSLDTTVKLWDLAALVAADD